MHLRFVSIEAFLGEHQEFFERQESRFNILLGLSLRLKKTKGKNYRLFSFGRPGAAALQMEGRNIVLGDLGPDDCAELVSHYSDIAYPGVVGPDSVADWFVSAAGSALFEEGVSQGIFQLDGPPRKPPIPGFAEKAADTYRLVKWIGAFHMEADLLPEPPSRDDLLQRVENSKFYFWIDEGEPVAMAGIVREGIRGATIGAVYTPKEHRGHRYGEAITAYAAGEILKSGKLFSSLYTDLSNPASNKIYERIGYRQVCRSRAFRRKTV